MKKLSITDAVSLVSIAGVGVICVSLAYEHGFARGLGLDIIDLSLSPQDFIKSAAAWAPYLFVGFIGIFLLESLTSHVEGGRTNEEIENATQNPLLTRKVRRSPDYLLLVLGVILGGALIWDADFIRPVAHLSYSLIWVCVVGFLLTRDSIKRKFSPRLMFSIWAIVGVVLLVHGNGQHDAITGLKRKDADVLELNSGTTTQGQLLRRYTDFVLFIPTGDTHIAIIPSAEVRIIKKAKPSH